MNSESKLHLALAALAGVAFVLVLGLRAQAPSIGKLAQQSANISEMDWVLLRTRVYVLEQILKD